MVRRSDKRLDDLGAMRTSFDAVVTALPTERGKASLFLDLRVGPRRNDEEFDKLFERFLVDVCRDFFRVAVVVRTATGKLQIQRYARAKKLVIHTFLNERLALSFLEV